MVEHPVTQVTGKTAALDILDLSKVSRCFYSSSGLGLGLGKDLYQFFF